MKATADATGDRVMTPGSQDCQNSRGAGIALPICKGKDLIQISGVFKAHAAQPTHQGRRQVERD